VGFHLVQRRGQAYGHPHHRLALHRQIGDDVAQDWRVYQVAVESPTVAGVMDRLVQRLPHQPGGADGEI
jgi:hypothetical protein